MRAAFILTFLANVALTLGSLVILPSRVAIHFGSGGVPDSWAPSVWNALAFVGIEAVLFRHVIGHSGDQFLEVLTPAFRTPKDLKVPLTHHQALELFAACPALVFVYGH